MTQNYEELREEHAENQTRLVTSLNRHPILALLLAVLVRMPQALLPLGLAAALSPVASMFTAALAVGSAGLGSLLTPWFHHRFLRYISPRALLLSVSMFHVLLLILIAASVHPLAGSLNAGYQGGWVMYVLALAAGLTVPIPQAVPGHGTLQFEGIEVSSSAISTSALGVAGALTAIHSLGSGGIATLVTSAVIAASAVPLAAAAMPTEAPSAHQLRQPVRDNATGEKMRFTEALSLGLIGLGLGGLAAVSLQLASEVTGPGLIGVVVISATLGALAASADLLNLNALSRARQGRLLSTLLTVVAIPLLPVATMLDAEAAMPMVCAAAAVVGYCAAGMAAGHQRPKPQPWADAWKLLLLVGGTLGLLLGAWIAQNAESGWAAVVLLIAALCIVTIRLTPRPAETP